MNFNSKISYDGTSLIVGVVNEYRVLSFQWKNNDWSLREEIEAPSPISTNSSFGETLDISADGSTLVVSDTFDDYIEPPLIANKIPGASWVFDRVLENSIWRSWKPGQKLVDVGGIMQGGHLSLSHDGLYLAVGGSAAVSYGSIFLFTRPNKESDWYQVNVDFNILRFEVQGSSESASILVETFYNKQIGIHEKIVITSDPYNGFPSGKGIVPIFSQRNAEWINEAVLESPTSFLTYNFGKKIVLSENANILVVHSATNFFVYTRHYKHDKPIWTLRQRSIQPIETFNDPAIDLSADGRMLVFKDGNTVRTLLASPQ